MDNLRYKTSRGTALPLGVTIRDGSVNMSIVAPYCKSCKIHLFDKNDSTNKITITVPEQYKIGDICCVNIEGLVITQYEYVYEIDGRIVMDPYAKVVVGKEKWGKFDQYFDQFAVRGGFAVQDYDWQDDAVLDLPYKDMILYKMHIRGFTKHYSSSCGKTAGTYRGAIDKIPYLKELGINAVLLMPIIEFNEILIDASMLHYIDKLHTYNRKQVEFVNVAKSENAYREEMFRDICDYEGHDPKLRIPYRVNYWGYSKQNYYFAPKAAYAYNPSDVMNELKMMVHEFHKAGIEVIMEFNFTRDLTQQTILDCLHYWFFTYHIDGFCVNDNVVLTKLLVNDPVLAKTKFLATSWDLSQSCDQTKNQKYGQVNGSIEQLKRRNLAEYNDGFLVDIRRYLKGDEEQVATFAARMRRNPMEYAIINYITNNNGFTLYDLVSYDRKHNQANGEDNIDGTDYNYSWNCGTEGKTTKKKILKLRKQQIKNALTMLLLSQGTPMIMMGDEFCNSQDGNNNAYCQDTITSWLNWNNLKKNDDIVTYIKKLIHLRKTAGFCGREEEYKMLDVISCGCPDLSYHGTKAWYPDFSNYSRVFGVMYCGSYTSTSRDKLGRFYYIAFNMHWEQHEFDLPHLPIGQHWKICINTCEEDGRNSKVIEKAQKIQGKEPVTDGKVGLTSCSVSPRSIVVLCSDIDHKCENIG